jgi:hypothetical protein
MTVRQNDGTSKLLQVEQADVTVRFLGDIAETVLDLRFRNDGDRAVEGEFVLPLPEGATVSAYALEVNGKMRAGVAVEKQRARIAYESVKRRMIDPGIVEREAGNIYRTKVYPVPAKGTKRLRISYNETLQATAQGLAYALPLDFSEALDSFSCKLRGAAAGAIRITSAAGLEFVPDNAGGLRAVRKDATLTGTLKLMLQPPAGPFMILENNPVPTFFLSDRVPEIAPRPRPAPATVMLVWDASASGLNRNPAQELALLDAWFAKLGTTRVTLRLLRERLTDAGEFEIRRGRWSKLKQALQQVDYDGGTDLSRLQVTAGQADLVVLVGDGVATLGSTLPCVAVPWVFIRTGSTASAHALTRLAHASGGAVIDPATDNKTQALAKLTHQPLRLLAVKGADITSVMLDEELIPGRALRVLGTLRESRAGKVELRYGFGNDLATTREVTYQTGGDPDGIVRRLHAQRVLADLEQAEQPDPKQIIEHCKNRGLVSDYTSLIVLERIEDYAEHQIQPPEPELQDAYYKLVNERTQQRAADLGGLAWAWAKRLHWYRQSYPGYEALLLPRVRQVRIWKTAVESQFAPAQRDAQAFATIAGWLEKATGLIARKPEPLAKDDYQAWSHAIDELHAQGPKLAQTPLHLPPANQPLTVSVRGLVVKPSLVTGTSGMTLRQAIEKAGGLKSLGGLDNVALYRNAGKIVYNTLSNRYQDIPLFPGDMLVVGRHGLLYGDSAGYGADPFAAPQPPPDPGKNEPIREQGDLWPSASARRDPFVPFRASDPFDRPPAGRRSLSADFSGGGFPLTPASPPVSRRWRGYEPPQIPSTTGGSTPTPPPSDSTTRKQPPQPRQIERAAANAATLRNIDRNEIAPPDLAAFAKDIAAGRDPAAAYRTLKGRRIYQPDFYLEAARILFSKHHVELAQQVLSNLTESRPGDVSALRSYAYWLAEFGQAAEADAVLCAVPANDPAALPVLLDRASILATNDAAPADADALVAFFGQLTTCPSGQLAAVALTEYNALRPALKQHNKSFQSHPLHDATGDYRQNLAADIRIVVTSSGDEDSLHLEVSEPGGFLCAIDTSPSAYGGQITAPPNMREYMLRHAVPGTYQIRCVSAKQATIRAVIHRHWGQPDHTFKVVTMLLDAAKPRTIAEVVSE